MSLCNDPPSVRPSVTNFNIGNISDTIYNSYESWPKGSLWGDLQNYMTLGDLDFLSRSQYLPEIWKKQFLNNFDNISGTIHCRVVKHGLKVAWRGDLQNDVTLGDLD